jgi:hypothetical protein
MVYKVCPFIGSLLGIYHGITLYLDHRQKSTTRQPHNNKQKYSFLLFFFILSLGHSISLLITTLPLWGKSYEEINDHSALCNNNAVPVDNHDGFTACAVQAGLRTYFFFGACAAWALICADLFVKIVLQQKFTSGGYFNFSFQVSRRTLGPYVYSSVIVPMLPCTDSELRSPSNSCVRHDVPWLIWLRCGGGYVPARQPVAGNGFYLASHIGYRNYPSLNFVWSFSICSAPWSYLGHHPIHRY